MTQLAFTVDSALLGELGERLVEQVHYALVELVKNAYDADARDVVVKFVEDNSGRAEIWIIDDGIGMNFSEVENYWMHIATTNKAQVDVSGKYGRPKTGSKGIGRFCCRRLGKKLTLITEGKNDEIFEKTSVTFDWARFKPGTKVTEIFCDGQQEVSTAGSSGTTLIITDLLDEWTKRGYDYLKRQLAVLAANRGVKRKGFEEDPGFNIAINAPGFEGELRDIRHDLINSGWGTLKAYINKNNQAVCELDALGIGRKTIVSEEIYKKLNDISLNVGIMVLLREQMRDTNIASIGTLREIIPDWGGVQVRYKGFRVYPYGDDDWLNIDIDRSYRRGTPTDELQAFAASLRGVDPGRALLSLLSMRNYIGDVEIGPHASGFIMKANREGFLQSDEFEELRKFVRFSIDWSTIYRDFYLREQVRKDAELSREIFQEDIGTVTDSTNAVEAAVRYIEKEFKNVAAILPTQQRQSVSSAFLKATDVILKHEQYNKGELNHLRLIASTSTLLLIFSHEVKALLGFLEDIGNKFSLFRKYLPDTQVSRADAAIHQLQEAKSRFNDLLKMTALIGVDSKKEEPKKLALKDRVKQSIAVFDLIRKGYGIDISAEEVPNNIMVGPILEAELFSILLNLLSNSIKSVIAAGETKKIKLIAIKEGSLIKLRISDSGIGLDPMKDHDIFIPFVADQSGTLYSRLAERLNPEDKYIVGTGSGLGLSIVKEILSARNGDIKILPPTDIWKAIIEVTLNG